MTLATELLNHPSFIDSLKFRTFWADVQCPQRTKTLKRTKYSIMLGIVVTVHRVLTAAKLPHVVPLEGHACRARPGPSKADSFKSIEPDKQVPPAA